MAIQKLVLDTLEDDEYELLAIHSSLAPYRLAFLLNKHLDLKLFRTKEDLTFAYDSLTASFPLYQYDDHFQYSTYHLVGNKFRSTIPSTTSASNGGLFPDNKDAYVVKYVVPELKNVDYFLKIDTESSLLLSDTVITKMLTISQVVTTYSVAYQNLKSKNNLIFE